MDNSTLCSTTQTEDLTSSELSERYFSLKKQYNYLSSNFDTIKQELNDTRRSYQTALDIESQLNVDFDTYQVEEQKRKNELLSRITTLQEEISLLRTECSQIDDQNIGEIKKLETENHRLKEQQTVISRTPERDIKEVDEIRSLLSSATSDSVSAKAALEEARAEIASWRLKIEELVSEIGELRVAAEIRREEINNAVEREAVALADLAEARALLPQVNSLNLEPHAVKGNSVFAEVEDKRQEMAKNLIQMKQTNARLRRELANKQAEVEALLHEKQTVWEQQTGTTAQYDRELIEIRQKIKQAFDIYLALCTPWSTTFTKDMFFEVHTVQGPLLAFLTKVMLQIRKSIQKSYEDQIGQLEELCERQWREINRGLGKLCEHSTSGWQPGVLDHLKTEREKLRAEVLAKSAAQLASAAQVRELRRKIVLQTVEIRKQSPAPESDDIGEICRPKLFAKTVDNIKKKVSFN